MKLLHVATAIYPLQLPLLLQVVMQYEELLLNFGLAIAAAPSAILHILATSQEYINPGSMYHCIRQWPMRTLPCTHKQAVSS